MNYLCTWSGFAPYKGHPAASDFYQFKEDSLILFADEAPDFYVLTKWNNIIEQTNSHETDKYSLFHSSAVGSMCESTYADR